MIYPRCPTQATKVDRGSFTPPIKKPPGGKLPEEHKQLNWLQAHAHAHAHAEQDHRASVGTREEIPIRRGYGDSSSEATVADRRCWRVLA
jgi:hypothetical protein